MRLSACITALLLAGFVAISANAQVSINRINQPITTILSDIESQTDYLFVYPKDVQLDSKVTVRVINVTVPEALDKTLYNSRIGYKFSEKHIVLFNITSSDKNGKDTDYIKGKITDEEGEPIIGASVILNGKTTSGVMSDINGNYAIKAKKGDILSVSCLGFETKEVTVGNSVIINIQLAQDIQYLDEVVFIGYGSSSRKDLTGSVSQVRATQVEKEAPRSIADAIRGGVAGLTLGMANTPGGTASIQIRGKNTLDAGSSPLYVLDGVIYNGELTDINPNDIESIDVLKDASSVAIYGAKAANGVIAITTKRGTTGAPKVTFNANMGVVTPANLVKMVDGAGFVKFREDYHEGLRTDAERDKYPGMYSDPRTLEQKGIDLLDWYNYTQNNPVAILPDEETLISAWLSRLGMSQIEINNYLIGNETDWDDEYFKNGLQQDYTVSIANKNEKASYYASLGYANMEGTIVGSGYENYRARVNLDSHVTKWLTVGLSTQFAARNSGWLKADTEQRKHLPPYAPNDIDNPESEYQHYPNGNNNCVNPFYNNLYTDRRSWNYELTGNLYAKVRLPFGFEYQMNFSPRQHFYEYYNHQSSENESWAGIGGSSVRTVEHTFNWQIDNILRWNKSFGDNRFELTLLQNAEQNKFWSTTAENQQYSPSDILSYHRLQSGKEPTVSSNDTYSTGDALMARLFYSYKNKYMFTGSVRRDGYSAFGQANPRATFPSLAVAWVFSEEKFMNGCSDWLNYGKFRASYGINGNRDIGMYAALAQLTTGMSTYMDITGTPYMTSQVYVSVLGNRSLKWEKTGAWNIGLDFSLFNGFMDGSIDAYKSTTTDLLVDRTLPKITGFDSIKANLGELSNHGFEMTLNAHPLNTNHFKWDSNATFYFNRRKIVHLYGDMEDILDDEGNVIGQKEADDYDSKLFIGHDPDQIWAYERDGVWQLGEEEEALKYGCQPGDFKYIDQNKDNTLNSDDKVFQGYHTPRYQASWRNEVTFNNNLSLSCLMYGKFGHFDEYNRAANTDKMYDIYSSWDIPRWTRDNPTNDYGRLGSYNAGTNFVNKSFVRVENITISYLIPDSFLKRIKIDHARLSFAIRNPFVFTAWENGDVEGGDYTMRTYNINLNITL